MSEEQVAIICAGAWGTALAIRAARAGQRVSLWARDPARAAMIEATRNNPRLPGFRLPEAIRVTGAPPASASIVLLAVPVRHLREIVALLPAYQRPLVACAK